MKKFAISPKNVLIALIVVGIGAVIDAVSGKFGLGYLLIRSAVVLIILIGAIEILDRKFNFRIECKHHPKKSD